MVDLLLIMMFVFVTQVVVAIVVIKIRHKKSIDFIGPEVGVPLNRVCANNLKIDLEKEFVLIFFHFKCEMCRQLVKEVVKNDLEDSRIRFVSFGTKEDMRIYQAETNLNYDIVLNSEEFLRKELKVITFPFILRVKAGKVEKKGIASYELLCSYLGIE